MFFNFLGNKKKENFFWILDIGTEAVKAIIAQEEEGINVIFGAGIEYFDEYGFFGQQDLAEIILRKAVSKSINEALQRFSIISKSKAENQWRQWPVILGISPDMLKARVSCCCFERSKPKDKISVSERETIQKKCLENVRNETSNEFARETGILAEDIHWIRFEISEEKVDGYPLPDIAGLNGKEITAKVLVVFLGEKYFKNIESILSGLGLKISRISHVSENLFSLPDTEKSDSVLFDLGGDVTQFILIKSGCLKKIDEFKIGGRVFSQRLADVLGVSEELARILKERYSKGVLSGQSTGKVKEIFSAQKGYWKEKLELGLKKNGCEYPLSSDIFIFGGAADIPEIKDVLGGISARSVKIVYPKDLSGVEDLTKILNSPQYTSSLLIAK